MNFYQSVMTLIAGFAPLHNAEEFLNL